VIVTCPGCAANYRVRNEAVPDGGAKMRCPRCGTVFLALAPEGTGGGGGAELPESFASPTDGHAAQQVPFETPANTGSGNKHRVSTDLGQLMQSLGGPGGSPTQPPTPAPLPAGDLFPSPAQTGTPGAFGMGVGQSPVHGGAPPSVAIVNDDNDPFANIDLSQPAMPSTNLTIDDVAGDAVRAQAASGGPSLSLDMPTPLPRNPEADAALPRTRAVHTAVGQAPPAPQVAAGPTLGAFVASWVVLVLGVLVFAGGVVFSAWTVGVVNLDGALMPLFEEHLSVRPPISSVGRDDLKPAVVKTEAEAAELREDLVEAATHWRRVMALGEDPIAKRHLDELLEKLNHPGLL
jgi:predicted Zn finger-like uncharacterized protein